MEHQEILNLLNEPTILNSWRENGTCNYIKNRCRLIPVYSSRQKELDADPKAIQQIEFAAELKRNRC